MKRPTIIIGRKEHSIQNLTGRSWRLLGEFIDSAPEYSDPDFLEKHAAFIAQFYDGVSVDDVLDMPMEEILPASAEIRKFILESLTAKLEKIEKNSEEGKAQSS